MAADETKEDETRDGVESGDAADSRLGNAEEDHD
jgi:hypothetical protein